MRVLCILLLFTLLAHGQDVYTRTEVDVNGNRAAPGPTDVVTRNGLTQLSRSVNGGVLPVEKIEEHVLQDDANGKTVERLVKRYDATGVALPPVKEIIQQQKTASGLVTTRTVYQGDINGHMDVQERSLTKTQKSGDSENSETLVERPNINGGLEPFSRQVAEKIKNGDGYQETSTTYRPDPNGSFVPAVKVSTNVSKAGGHTTENTAEYEIGPTGQLRLQSQKVQSSVKRPDGSEDTQLQVYRRNLPGIAVTSDSQLQLIEQQHIERRKTSGDTVVETVNVQRPTLADPTQLGPPRQLSETVCKGKCEKPDQP